MKPRVSHLAITVALACHAVPQIAKAAPSPERLAWFEDYTREAIAAPVTLDNAVKYAWYRIPAAEWIKRQGVTRFDVGYLQEQLAQHGQTALAALKVQLDAKLGALQSVDEAGSYGDPKNCAWIMSLRSPDYQPTKLQEDLRQYCAEHALPALYKRLLAKRVAAFDVRLATLPHLNVDYPGDLLQAAYGTLGTDIAATYARDLDAHLKSAEPGVRADIAKAFQVKALGGGPLETAAAQCKALLRRWYPETNLSGGDTLRGRGPGSDEAAQFGHAVKVTCLDEASAWLTLKAPEVTAAVRASIAALDPNRERILSVQTRCTAILGRWFSGPADFKDSLTDPVSQACRKETEAFNLKAVEIRAKALTARFETAPRTLDGLERNTWFEPTLGEIQAVTDPHGPNQDEAEKALRDRVESLVKPSREAALQAATAEISSLYGAGSSSDADLGQARRLCAPYLGQATRTLSEGGTNVRSTVSKVCRDREMQVVVQRLKAFVAASRLDETLGRDLLTIVAPGGGLVAVNPQQLVVGAALNGLQVSFVPGGWFQKRAEVQVAPLGGQGPVLAGALIPEVLPGGTRQWRVDGLPALMGLNGSLATVECLMHDDSQADASFASGLIGLAFAKAFGFDWTSDYIAVKAIDARNVEQVCRDARSSFFKAARVSKRD